MSHLMAPSRRAGIPQGIILMMPSVFAVMGTAVLAPVLPLMMDHFHGMPRAGFWVPALLTAPSICIALLSPFIGLLCDVISRRKLIVAAMTFYAVVGVVPVALDSYNAILASRIGLGIFEAAMLVLMNALIADYFIGIQRDRWLSTQSAVASIAALGLLPLGGFAGALMGWRGPFLLYALAVPAALAIWLLTWETSRASSTGTERSEPEKLPLGWLVGMCLIAIFVGNLWFSLQVQIGRGFSAIGVDDPARIGLLASVALLGLPVGAIAFWKVAKVSLQKLLFMEFALAGLTLIGLARSTEPVLFVIFAFLHVVSNGLMLPTMLVHLLRRLPAAGRGRGIGLFQSAFAIGQFLSSLVISFLAGSGSIMDAFFRLGMCTLAVALGVFALLVRQRAKGTS